MLVQTDRNALEQVVAIFVFCVQFLATDNNKSNYDVLHHADLSEGPEATCFDSEV